MEESLLHKPIIGDDNRRDNISASSAGISIISWERLLGEFERLSLLAGPMIAITLSQYLLSIVALTMAGHLGKLTLSSTAIAISIANVSGFSVIIGLASALETLSGQAYGAQQFRKLGHQTQTAIFCLILVCIPLSVLWAYMRNILIMLGQDPTISREAGKFIVFLIPALFANAALHPLQRYFQAQSLINPMLIASFITLCFHVALCWMLVFHSRLRSIGAALSICFSVWFNVILLGLYMMFSSECAKTRAPLSLELFSGIKEFFRFAIPSTVMLCLEWWSFELLILLSGLLPNPELETSILSVCLTTVSTLYAFPYGLGAAASTRVSNSLGAGNAHAARTTVYAVICLTLAETVIVSTILFLFRHSFGYIFSNDKGVVDYATSMAPLLSLSLIFDSFQGVLSGVTRGCGWQHVGAYINLGAFYLCGIPIAVALAFGVQLRGLGLWLGIICGSFTQTILLFIVNLRINWEKLAFQTRDRIFNDSLC